jgi:adenylate kinase family enzyme
LANYNEATAPLLDYYRNTGKIRSVMASGEIDVIFAGIVKILR